MIDGTYYLSTQIDGRIQNFQRRDIFFPYLDLILIFFKNSTPVDPFDFPW